MNARARQAMWGVSAAACAAAQAALAAGTASNGAPAVWQPYDILVQLVALPHPYTCAQLWEKFRDVVLALGAGRVDELTPERCGSTSPAIHLRFDLPREVSGAAVQYMDIRADDGVVDLRPGKPAHLDSGDCPLVREIRDSLLVDLPVKVVSQDLHCTATAAPRRRGYDLEVRTLLPRWPDRVSMTSN